jgi:hypothetical protein
MGALGYPWMVDLLRTFGGNEAASSTPVLAA